MVQPPYINHNEQTVLNDGDYERYIDIYILICKGVKHNFGGRIIWSFIGMELLF
ncbi:MAG: hypothetical protein BAJATHORv1_90008 [Candidatus Thorarchaeota archaeon]|nr:MAG: hypothetical protein BAJATHORv1_90008 [Candidatus Thorarchaeota archaeon]